MEHTEQVKILTEQFGGNLWEAYGKCRVYFDGAHIASVQGLNADRYNSGNIMAASLNGEKISNSEAKRILEALAMFKIWYDFADGKFHTKGMYYKSEFGNRYAQAMYDEFTAAALVAIS